MNRWGILITAIFAVFLTGYIGYFVVDKIWPSFYYAPVAAGKNVWLLAQACAIGLYWLGLIGITLNVRKITAQAG